MKTFQARNLAEWHAWLQQHHLDEPEVWLIYRKTGSDCPWIGYEESIEEALCFGWVDSLIKNIDDQTHARKFTPRKPGSHWSDLNIARAKRMIAQGRMTGKGLRLFEEILDQSRPAGPSRKEQQEVWRGELMDRLSPETLTCYTALPPSLQRQYAGWVMSAKREETRQKRIEELNDTLRRGERLGLK